MNNEISATEPDWSREKKRYFEWNPPKSLLACIRSYQKAESGNFLFGKIIRIVAVVRHRFWTVITGADIPLCCKISGGLVLPHPNGIVIHPDAVIGPNCLIFQQVTIGNGHDGVPTILGHVDIGSGAKILGSIEIGNHSKIGANAVVLCNVPNNSTAVGIPAKIIFPKRQ